MQYQVFHGIGGTDKSLGLISLYVPLALEAIYVPEEDCGGRAKHSKSHKDLHQSKTVGLHCRDHWKGTRLPSMNAGSKGFAKTVGEPWGPNCATMTTTEESRKKVPPRGS